MDPTTQINEIVDIVPIFRGHATEINLCVPCKNLLTGSSPTGQSAKKYPSYRCPKCRTATTGHKVSVPLSKLHDDFSELLKSITPSEAHMKLFKAVFLSKWQEISKEVDMRRNSAEASIRAYRERGERVLDLFIHDQISYTEKQHQLQKIDKSIFVLEERLESVKTESVDAEVLIDFASHLMTNASKLWDEASIEQKRRLQTAIFPDGLSYDSIKGFGTIKTSELYGIIRTDLTKHSNVVGLDRVELSTKWL